MTALRATDSSAELVADYFIYEGEPFHIIMKNLPETVFLPV